MRILGILALAFLGSGPALADVELPTKFSNQGTVGNTRHNLTQRQSSGGGPSNTIMNPYRNDYEEVCVYCHTPHGGNAAIQLPLWNRTIKASTTYQTYDTLGTSTLTQPVTPPGPNSLACLSCHDGTTAVDSIINMPGGRSDFYQASQATAQDNTFLNRWNNSSGPDATTHLGLDAGNPASSCFACHSSSAGIVGAGATDFKAYAIGSDLRNDHPVGIRFPTVSGAGTDFKTPTATRGNLRFFDTNGNSRPDKDEIRLYDTGDGYEVECGSCHDPHGVPSGGPGSVFRPTFLRVANTGSAVCLTCHSK